jgi:hypothetical protein
VAVSHRLKEIQMQRKQFLRLSAMAFGAAALAPVITACGGGGSDVASLGTTPPPTTATLSAVATAPSSLSPEEIAGLKFMREEEKLAHDVYVALFNIWGANVFNQIAQSESQHTEAIRLQLVAYGLEDPAATTPAGVFENADLQALYTSLVAMGRPTLIDALKVGALIEEKDIQDIKDKKALVVDEPSIVQVYDNLLCGSRNHLRAFNNQLVNQGVTYVPQVITQTEWDAIASAPSETCGG